MHLPDMSPPGNPAGIGATQEAMYNSINGCRGLGAPDATVVTDSSRSRQGRKRQLNSLAQRRYRAKQKEQTQGLQETRQQLASKVAELQDVKKACTSLQVLHSTPPVFIEVLKSQSHGHSRTLRLHCARVLFHSMCHDPWVLPCSHLLPPSAVIYTHMITAH